MDDDLRPRPATTERDLSRPLEVDELRRLAALLDALPAGPWRVVELSDLEVAGPADWDPDVQPSREAHERDEQRRSERAAWRGVVAADGGRIVGEPVRGGTPQSVSDPAWRWAADSYGWAARLLETVRELWRQSHDVAPPPPVPTVREVLPVVFDHAVVDRAAAAAYAAVEGAVRWDDLSGVAREEWRVRARAALDIAAADSHDEG